MLTIKVVLIALSILSLGNLYSDSPRSYTFGVIVFPPLSVKSSDSTGCEGEAIDRTRHIIEASGNKFTLLCAPPARIYKMMELGQVDFTINVKSTELLKPYTTFIDPRFTTLKLQLYEYDKKGPNTISGIRGFVYLGYRQELIEQGFVFSDSSNPRDSVAMFFKERTKALVTYQRPISHYINTSLNGKLPDNIVVRELLSIGTYYGISKRSEYHDELVDIFNKYITQSGAEQFISDH